MVDVSNMSLKQLQEAQSRHAEVQASVNSITSTLNSNKFALLSLCLHPGFAEMCKKEFGLPDKMSTEEVRDFVRGRIFDDAPVEAPQGPGAVKPVKQEFYGSQPDKRPKKDSGKKESHAPSFHHLEVHDGTLSGKGYTGKDKSFVPYEWSKPSDYVHFWNSTESSRTGSRYNPYYGVYALRIHGEDNSVSDFTCGRYGAKSGKTTEGCVQELAKDFYDLEVRAYSSILLFRRLMQTVYDAYGDQIIQALGELMVASVLREDGVSPVYQQFLTSLGVLQSRGIDMNRPYHYMKLPGKFTINGIEDSIVIDNANVMSLKNQDGYTPIYKRFNNECFYIELVHSLICKVTEKSEDEVYQIMDEMFELLLRPHGARNK